MATLFHTCVLLPRLPDLMSPSFSLIISVELISIFPFFKALPDIFLILCWWDRNSTSHIPKASTFYCKQTTAICTSLNWHIHDLKRNQLRLLRVCLDLADSQGSKCTRESFLEKKTCRFGNIPGIFAITMQPRKSSSNANYRDN